MTSTALEHVLISIGLDKEEARLYIAGLKLGSAPASNYAVLSKLNRITAYNHLEKLVKQGLFSVVTKKKIKRYQPISPEKLQLEVRKNVEALDRVLPDLRGLMGNDHRTPKVRYFEGVEGIRDVYADTLTAGTELLNFANSNIVRTFWKEYDKEYVAKRVKQKIHLRGIAPDDKMGKMVQGKDKKSFREIRLVNAKEFPMNNEINIYDNKVAIIAFTKDQSDLFGVIIESKEVADTQKQIFEMAWRYAILGDSSRKKEQLDIFEA